jgi:hypothetical protein
MVEQSAIWWVEDSAADGEEATAVSDIGNFTDGEIVYFNESPVVTAGGHIFESRFSLRNSVAENAKVDGDGNDVQDMGIDGINVTITGLFKDVDTTSGDAPIKKLLTWFRKAKTATGYTEGRLGLRLDDFPYFNMVPTATYGYVMQNPEFIRAGEDANKAGFTVNLVVGGDRAGWLTTNGF